MGFTLKKSAMSDANCNMPSQKKRKMREIEFIDAFDEVHFQMLIFDHMQSQNLAQLRIPVSRIPIIHNNEHHADSM